MNTPSDDPSLSEAHGERRDFDDGANAIWSLYGKVAQTHDEAHVQSLAKDMDGVLIFVRRYTVYIVALKSFTYIPIGWFVFGCSHIFPRPKHSEFASGPREAISILPAAVSAFPAAISLLPATVDCNSGSDLTANCIHRSGGPHLIHSPTGFHTVFRPIYRPTSLHPIHFPTALSCIRTIVF